MKWSNLPAVAASLAKAPLTRLYSITPSTLQSIYNIEVYAPHPKTIQTSLLHCIELQQFLSHHVLASHTIAAFQEACSFVDKFYDGSPNQEKLVILDSGCGTGRSTLAIAAKNPAIPVLGIDRSLVRLSKNKEGPAPANHCFIRADLVDFFLLALEKQDWIIHSHYILYPNPYPKARHLKRRFHGHPVFPIILALGGQLHVRSNWFIYPQETFMAVDAITKTFNYTAEDMNSLYLLPYIAKECITNFEAKYVSVGLPLYECRVDLQRRNWQQRKSFIERLTRENPAAAAIVLDAHKEDILQEDGDEDDGVE